MSILEHFHLLFIIQDPHTTSNTDAAHLVKIKGKPSALVCHLLPLLISFSCSASPCVGAAMFWPWLVKSWSGESNWRCLLTSITPLPLGQSDSWPKVWVCLSHTGTCQCHIFPCLRRQSEQTTTYRHMLMWCFSKSQRTVWTNTTHMHMSVLHFFKSQRIVLTDNQQAHVTVTLF